MPESISTSKQARRLRSALAALLGLMLAQTALAQQEPPPGIPQGGAGAPDHSAKKDDRTLQPEEEDYSTSPYTEYGEFNEEDEEAADTKFFQYGRLFGVSVGAGFEGATGNRGSLWQGGFPLIDFKVHYWFDFNVAMDLGLTNANHTYVLTAPEADRISVSMVRLGVDLKYYIDTKNLSAAISFANPYLLVGAGQFAKTETFQEAGGSKSENSFGLSAGAGLEFAIRPRKTYFTLETKFTSVRFEDTDDSGQSGETANPRIADRSGIFYTITASILFTW